MLRKLSFLLALLPFSAFATTDDCATRTTVPSGVLNLPQIIELGLCRNPQTASSYLAYESARFAKNAGYADYLPSVNLSASASLPYRNREWGDWSYGASLSASYLIFDFGKRLSDQNQLIDAWRASGFEYDETVQNYIYGVIGYAVSNDNINKLYFTYNGVSYQLWSDCVSVSTLIEVASGMEFVTPVK